MVARIVPPYPAMYPALPVPVTGNCIQCKSCVVPLVCVVQFTPLLVVLLICPPSPHTYPVWALVKWVDQTVPIPVGFDTQFCPPLVVRIKFPPSPDANPVC